MIPALKAAQFMCFVPEGRAKDLLRFCFVDLGLPAQEAANVLSDARQLAAAIALLSSDDVVSSAGLGSSST